MQIAIVLRNQARTRRSTNRPVARARRSASAPRPRSNPRPRPDASRENCNLWTLAVVFNGRPDSPGGHPRMRAGESGQFFSDKGKGEGDEEVTGIRISTGYVRVRRFDCGGEGGGGGGRGQQFFQRARAAVGAAWETQSQPAGQSLESPRRSPRHDTNTLRAFRQAALPRDLSGPHPAER